VKDGHLVVKTHNSVTLYDKKTLINGCAEGDYILFGTSLDFRSSAVTCEPKKNNRCFLVTVLDSFQETNITLYSLK
jgi:hypothetical protein